MSQNFQIKVDLTGLREHMTNIVKSAQEVVRPAAQAGAQVLYDAAKANVKAIGRKTGNLDRAIYQKYSTDNSGKFRATYHVSWNINKAPHGRLVEWGFIQRYEVWYSKKYGKYYIPRRAGVKKSDIPKRQKNPPYSHRAAYAKLYRTLPVPVQVPAQSFMRKALAEQGGNARKAMRERFLKELRDRGFFRKQR